MTCVICEERFAVIMYIARDGTIYQRVCSECWKGVAG